MTHCCFTKPPSAGYHINLGHLTKVFCSCLGIIFTGVKPGLAFPQVSILPVLFEEPDRSFNSPTDPYKPCCFSLWTVLLLKAGPIPLLKAGTAFHWTDPRVPELQTLSSSYHTLSASTASRGRRHWHLLVSCIAGKRLTSHCQRNSALGYTQHDTLGFTLLHGPSWNLALVWGVRRFCILSWIYGCFLIVSLSARGFPANIVV